MTLFSVRVFLLGVRSIDLRATQHVMASRNAGRRHWHTRKHGISAGWFGGQIRVRERLSALRCASELQQRRRWTCPPRTACGALLSCTDRHSLGAEVAAALQHFRDLMHAVHVKRGPLLIR